MLAPPGRAGDVLLRRLGKNLAERGGELIRGARARRPIMKGGRCMGVTAEVAGAPAEFHAKAVILADGGFQASPDLLREHITARPEALHQRNAGTGIGDGARIATEAGAALTGMDRFYGHVLSIDARTNPMLWPYPYLDAIVVEGILVGADGARFTDEGRGGVYAANGIAGLDDPLSAFVVFDQTIWESGGRHGLIPSNPHLLKQGGALHEASSLGALATMMGVPSATLEATVSGYNAAVDTGAIAALTPPRGTIKGAPAAIRTPPFYAAPVCAGITYTMGGVAIDGHARALRADDTVIEGLYAVGATTGGLEGGLEGGPDVGYVGGLSKSAVTGLRAAEHAAGQPAD